MRHLDVVVRGDAPAHAHDFAADLACKSLLHIALLLVCLPIGVWLDLEMFENVDVGVLPNLLDHGYVG